MNTKNYYVCHGCMNDKDSIPCGMIVDASPAIPNECPFSVHNYRGPNCFTPTWNEINEDMYKSIFSNLVQKNA